MPRCPTSKSPGAFNAHNPGEGGGGLVQPVFRSPARIPAAKSTQRTVRRAAKRKTLYVLTIDNGQSIVARVGRLRNLSRGRASLVRLGGTALATRLVKRKLTAILAADVAGYSRLMQADEDGMHRTFPGASPRARRP